MPYLRLISSLVCLSLVAACGASQSEVDNLNRRMATLEKRVRSLEGGGGGGTSKAKAKSKGKSKSKTKVSPAQPPSADRARVDVDGDALKVLLQGLGRQWPVPGVVPAGEYKIFATFADGAASPAGAITVKANTAMRVTCTGASSKCTVALSNPAP